MVALPCHRVILVLRRHWHLEVRGALDHRHHVASLRHVVSLVIREVEILEHLLLTSDGIDGGLHGNVNLFGLLAHLDFLVRGKLVHRPVLR